jgi:hypothetical protein
MTNGKKKSSGWRPRDKRGTWRQRDARRRATERVQLQHDCDRLRLWQACPSRHCLRLRTCAGNPQRCWDRRDLRIVAATSDCAPGPAIAPAPQGAADTRAAPRFALSSSEAAAAIARSIAAAEGAEPRYVPGTNWPLLPCDDLAAILGDQGTGQIRRRR